MFAVGIKWNDKAKTMIASREYRYVSPVFCFDGTTDDVQRIVSVAITNNPALPSLTDLSQVAVNSSSGAQVDDPRNARGMELIRRMNERHGRSSVQLNAEPMGSRSQFAADMDPRNQRGMELLRSMVRR